MGEHKLKMAGNGDQGKEPRKLSTHIVRMVDCPVPGDDTQGLQEAALEAAYGDLAERAKTEDSYILNVIQSVSLYQTTDGPHIGARMFITIVAQRISREELEAQQLRARMGAR